MSLTRRILQHLAAVLVFAAFIGTMALGSILERILG